MASCTSSTTIYSTPTSRWRRRWVARVISRLVSGGEQAHGGDHCGGDLPHHRRRECQHWAGEDRRGSPKDWGVVAKSLELRHLFSGHKVKGEEAQTAEVVDVKGLLPQKRDYLTYQVKAFNLILVIMMCLCRALWPRLTSPRESPVSTSPTRSQCPTPPSPGDKSKPYSLSPSTEYCSTLVLSTFNRMQQLRYGGPSSPRMVNNCRFKDFRLPSHQNINPYCVCACQVPRSKLIFIIPLFVHRNPSTLGCGVRRLATCSGNPPNVDQISLPISSPEDICRER